MKSFYIIFIMAIAACDHASCRDLTQEPGHLKPFGFGRPNHPVDEVQGFPDPETFFRNYVFSLKPLKMIGASKLSPGFSLWSDDYFLSLEESSDHNINVETVKKESRKQQIIDMKFSDFLRIYNVSEKYMVDSVPEFLGKDVLFPCPVQCDDLMENNLVETVMWFSSGGTKSVVHFDSVDNINCLFRGEKELVFVDPSKYGDKVDIDGPEGAYSAVDVDSVDYLKYPDLADVEFYHVNVSAGDCLYIPYRWIHQVRSYGSNLAINIWWNHQHNVNIDFKRCNAECNTELTLDQVKFKGFGELANSYGNIRDHLLDFLNRKKILEFESFKMMALGRYYEVLKGQPDIGDDYLLFLSQMYALIDTDKDGIVTEKEIKESTEEKYIKISKLMSQLDLMLDKMFEDFDPSEEDMPHDEL
ncbi:hypothetical protein ACJMK2_030019 [Sinanodonta woodiana]|uniref:JmjC domain-containing protein n=1 Tax=Sinanodonta woodiana TaxID=1069815 RepID=A0ABD3XEE2_SINWO